jgi:tRNA dimethylallyltransferase
MKSENDFCGEAAMEENNCTPNHCGGEAREKAAVILGPTAAGKTELSLDIAEQLGGEIISCDSMQVYKHMNIGAAKLSPQLRRNIPHHLLDIIEPNEPYNAVFFQRDVRRCVKEINAAKSLPIMVGGSGLYIYSAINPFLFSDISEDKDGFRESKMAEFHKDRGLSLHRELAEYDPQSAQKIHRHDKSRIIRALEFYHYNGYPISEARRKNEGFNPNYNCVLIGLRLERDELYRRVNERTDNMLASGLIDEVINLRAMGYGRELNAMQGLGYRQINAYLDGEYTLEEAANAIKTATRRFAKRQMTWFKRMNGIIWFNKGDYTYKGLREAVISAIRLALCLDK